MLETIVVGALETNCYIIADEMTKDAAIIDPGAEGRRIAKRVEAMGLTVRYILVTHGHMDHMKAVSYTHLDVYKRQGQSHNSMVYFA